jgi:N6-L-threonylcarbamoyladenine synthase
MPPVILAIESSCDETSAAIIRNGKVLNNVVASQQVHRKYGGVIPELASRAHQRNIHDVVNDAMTTAGVHPTELDAVAFTKGPGLMGALLVGASFAKGISIATSKPLIGVNHMEAHILAHFIQDSPETNVPSFPFLCLTVSGGHTQIVLVRDYLDMNVIGETRDDAVGEAFDKAAKILGLPYPGGPLIDKHASKGNADAFTFPDTQMPGLDFSFSGIKTAFLYFIRDQKVINPEFVDLRLNDICASLQKHLVGMLMRKLEQAAVATAIKQVAVAGGVSANTLLRTELKRRGNVLGWKTYIPAFEYCTDNAAMVAMAAHFKFEASMFEPLDTAPEPSLALGE